MKQRVLLALLLPAALVGVWYAAIEAGWLPTSLIASPMDVVRGFARLVASGELLAHCRVSLARILAGFTIGTIGGIVVGVAVAVWLPAERIVAPTIRALAPIPPTAWIPLLIIVFGIQEESKIALIAIGAFVTVYVNTLQGTRGTDRQLLEVAEALERSRLSTVWYVHLPSAAPSVFTGMRVGLGLSWILLVASELISAPMASAQARLDGLGLGWLIFDARRFSRVDEMIVGMITIGALGFASDWLLSVLERAVLPWRHPRGAVGFAPAGAAPVTQP